MPTKHPTQAQALNNRTLCPFDEFRGVIQNLFKKYAWMVPTMTVEDWHQLGAIYWCEGMDLIMPGKKKEVRMKCGCFIRQEFIRYVKAQNNQGRSMPGQAAILEDSQPTTPRWADVDLCLDVERVPGLVDLLEWRYFGELRGAGRDDRSRLRKMAQNDLVDAQLEHITGMRLAV